MAALGPRHQAAVRRALDLPPLSYFAVSAVFHYLGPAFAVLLFQRVDVLGVAWFRIAAAAAAFGVWRRPWRLLRSLSSSRLPTLLFLGFVLAAMNCTSTSSSATGSHGTVAR